MSQNAMYEDFERAGKMEVIAKALSSYVQSLAPGGEFILEGKRWVYRHQNFVTFSVQPKKAGVMLTLSGSPGSFRERMETFGFRKEYENDLERERTSYSRYPVRSPGQLLVAAQLIKWAFDNFNA
jgi:hypothetical protein